MARPKLRDFRWLLQPTLEQLWWVLSVGISLIFLLKWKRRIAEMKRNGATYSTLSLWRICSVRESYVKWCVRGKGNRHCLNVTEKDGFRQIKGSLKTVTLMFYFEFDTIDLCFRSCKTSMKDIGRQPSLAARQRQVTSSRLSSHFDFRSLLKGRTGLRKKVYWIASRVNSV